METKKSPKADLQKKRTIFLLVGLLLAMIAIVVIFSWSRAEKTIDQIAFNENTTQVEIADVVVVPDKPQVEPPKVLLLTDMIKLVDNDARVDVDPLGLLTTDFDPTTINFKPFAPNEEPLDNELIPVITAEEMPLFQGQDINAFRQWCGANLVYPQIAQENNIQGRVFISFVIERDGSVSNVNVMRGVDAALNAAAIQVVSRSPKWSPGKNRGKAVRFTYNLPIDFVLR